MKRVEWRNDKVKFSYDENRITIKDIFKLVEHLPINCPDCDTSSPTILYSGMVSDKKTSAIVPLMKGFRCIDKTTIGQFLGDKRNESFIECLCDAIKNDINNGTFDETLAQETLSTEKFQETKQLITKNNLKKATAAFLPAILYHPTRGLWAKVSERFVKATPNESNVLLLIPNADPGRTFAKVELPTALDKFGDNHIFGGFSIVLLKRMRNHKGISDVFDLLRKNSQNEEALFEKKYDTENISNEQFAEALTDTLLRFNKRKQELEASWREKQSQTKAEEETTITQEKKKPKKKRGLKM